MPRDGFILALDEGTTSARALLLNHEAEVLSSGQFKIRQFYPKPGWVEQDPRAIWGAQLRAARKAIRGAKISPGTIAAVGITNQRETTVLWDRETGEPVHNAIVWQCRRTAEIVERLKPYAAPIKERTGLIPDSYFSGPKIRWILDNVPGLRGMAERGDVLFGTVDSWLIYNLTGGRVHAVDYSNASRTMLFDIRRLRWDTELLGLLGVPEAMLPEPRPSSGIIGYTDPKLFGASIPIAGVLGDQQAALFGQTAFTAGEAKCTYGTGNFMLMNTGAKPAKSDKLLTTVAWSVGGETTYALEGSVFATGAAVEWLRDAGVAKTPREAEALAKSLQGNDGVYFVPALTGLGAPHWDQYSRGTILGLTRGTGRAHIARATLEAIAYLTRDVSDAMEAEGGVKIRELRVDGGATKNDFLMQFQADVLGKRVVRPANAETSALGAAFAAGLAVDYWGSKGELAKIWHAERVYEPAMSEGDREGLYSQWREAVTRSLGWAKTGG
ncbi:MAG: glycerol kinase GlpK [Candidatus Bathyarchaeota archaeon]|nr:glycerol kinase GlpK [Candidatus Bathyarchaeota archaeon]